MESVVRREFVLWIKMHHLLNVTFTKLQISDQHARQSVMCAQCRVWHDLICTKGYANQLKVIENPQITIWPLRRINELKTAAPKITRDKLLIVLHTQATHDHLMINYIPLFKKKMGRGFKKGIEMVKLPWTSLTSLCCFQSHDCNYGYYLILCAE